MSIYGSKEIFQGSLIMNDEIILENVLKDFSRKLPKFEDGRIDYSTSDKAPVLNCFVKFEDKVLILKRSDKVLAYQGVWNSVGGYLDDFRPFEEKVLEELSEELGVLSDMVKIIKLGEPSELVDENINKTWIIFPVLVELKIMPEIKLDWEHSEFKWIHPADLKEFEIVPGLDKMLSGLLKK